MLVDLGRNDLGRVCRFGSVSVPEFMKVERYSHVAHIVSSVTGELPRGHGRPRRAARDFSRGHAFGRAQDPGHGDHRRAGAGAPRPLRRRHRLRGPAREPGLLHHHPHGGACATGRPTSRRGRASWPTPIPPPKQRETEAKAGAVFEALRLAGGLSAVRVLLLDNYDSFTYNLYQYLGELGAEVEVVRNDQIGVDEALGAAARPHRHLARPRQPRPGGHQPGAGARACPTPSRCSGSAWATRPWARPSAARSSVPRR